MNVAERDSIWIRDGVSVEELPDPFPAQSPPEAPEQQQRPRRRRRWPLVLYSVAALFFITVLWLIITAPLSRALEPLADPAMLLVSDDGHPIAMRGAIKEAPVDVTKLDPMPEPVAARRYVKPGWFTRNIFNRLVAILTRTGLGVWGSRELRVRGLLDRGD